MAEHNGPIQKWPTIPVLGLLLCTLAPAQKPSPEEQRRTVDAAREIALDYTGALPDFICTEMVQRMETVASARNTTTDKLTIQLTYFGQKEKYKLIAINGTPATQSLESLAGLISGGEFGTALLRVFDPSSMAAFEWKRSSSIRQRRTAVYTYHVARPKSHYVLGYRNDAGEMVQATAGYHGEVDLDSETLEVLRVTTIADDIPKESRILESSVELDYDLADVAGRRYLLPARADSTLARGFRTLRNLVTFTGYRKFEAESTIDFGGRGH